MTFKVQGSGNITDKNNSTTFRTKVDELNQTKKNIVVGKGIFGTSLAAGSNVTPPKETKGNKRKPTMSSNEDTDKEEKTTLRKEKVSNSPKQVKMKKRY